MKLACVVMVIALLSVGGCSGQKPSGHAQMHDDAIAPAVAPVVSDVKSGDLTISHYAVRATLGNGTSSAAYVTIANGGKTEDRLLSVSCNCATSVSLHQMSMEGNMMNMGEAKDGFPIPAGRSLALMPGGNHIMLAGLKAPLKVGQAQTVVLIFARAGAIKVDLPVTNALPSDGM